MARERKSRGASILSRGGSSGNRVDVNQSGGRGQTCIASDASSIIPVYQEMLLKEKGRDTTEAMSRTYSRRVLHLMINLARYARHRLAFSYQAPGEPDPGSEPGLTQLH